MTAPLSVAERVAAGISWLDVTKPRWPPLVDLSKLDMRDGSWCPRGQVFAEEAAANGACNGYEYAMRLDKGEGVDDRVSMGFCAEDGEWDELEAAWRDAIEARFDSGLLSDSGEGAE